MTTQQIPVQPGRPHLPPIAEPYQLPFHYGSLHNIGVDYLVDAEPARRILADRHPALTAADFDGRACVSLNYQLYFAQYRNGFSVTQEIEISIIAHPTASTTRVPRVSYEQYAQGFDQTKLLGIARLHVLCDNPLAIDAGTRLFAEPKHPAGFTATMPSPNGPDDDSWEVTCTAAELSADGRTLLPGDLELLSLTADLNGLARRPVNNTPITGYGTTPDGLLLAAPLNVRAPYDSYPLTPESAARRIALKISAPDRPAGADLVTLVGDSPAVGVWTHQSPPVAAHNRPYYIPAG